MDRLQTFAEFWPFYLGEHRRAPNRWLHFAGSSLAMGLAVTGAVTGRWWLLGLAIFSGYAFAWIGHFAIEKNRPATFKYPLWSFIADWKMWGLTLLGRLPSELRRQGLP
jgi:hypothetical protein